MVFDKHDDLKGRHAFIGASQHSWVNWDEEKTINSLQNSYAQRVGTLIHEKAEKMILKGRSIRKQDIPGLTYLIDLYLFENGIPMYAYNANTIVQNLVPYINDGIGFRMTPEVVLWYSDNCFGTADTVAFNEKKKELRIHDLKTGVSPASMDQLLVYSALFFLAYSKKLAINVEDVATELRIYQSEEVAIYIPSPEEIMQWMEAIILHDDWIKHYQGVK